MTPRGAGDPISGREGNWPECQQYVFAELQNLRGESAFQQRLIQQLSEKVENMGQGLDDATSALATLTETVTALVSAVTAYMTQEAAAIAALQAQLAAAPSEDGNLETIAQGMASLNTTTAAALATITSALPAPTPTPATP